MASTATYSAVKAALAEAAAPLRVYDFEEVDAAAKNSAQPFLALVETGGIETLVSVGAPDAACFRETGVFEIHVFTQARDGYQPARLIVDQLRDALRRRSFAGVRVIDLSPPLPLGAYSGLWNETFTELNAEHDFIAAVA